MYRRQVLMCGVAVVGAGCATEPEEDPTQENTSAESSGVADTQGYILRFGEALEELNIEIRRLEEQLPTVELTYRTHQQGYQAVADEIGRIAGFYFREVDNGWGATRLNVETQVNGSETLRWYARSRWYQQYVNDELTAEELTLQVLETITRQE